QIGRVRSIATVKAFEEYSVLSKRELESRYDVWVEQYAMRANIEAEETFSIGQTMILPAGLRQLALISDAGVSALEGEIRELVDDLVDSGVTLERVGKHLKERFPKVTDVRSAVLWHKACSKVAPDYAVDFLPTNPWIHQPFEEYDTLRPHNLSAWIKRGT
ncbi:MAG: hypothetical protein J0I36_05630, partial [Pandoraea sp.]|nr:hypothetical protein [Pandoraea sp.]